MRSVILTASLLTALWLGLPAAAAAQPEPAPAPAPEAPPPPPPPPPARDYAVPRSERVNARESQPRTPDMRPPEDRPSPSESRTPARAPERVREAGDDSARRQPASASSSVGNATSDDQGAQRRGASRRPPAGDNSGSGAQSRDRAVPRTTARRPEPDRVYVYPDRWNYNRYYYDPFYDNGFGLGYLYYSPWGWTPSFYGSPYGYGYGGGYPGGRYAARGFDIGTVKLKVDQRDAEVFVDGYFAGHVDDFDGFLQALKLDSGAYRIEIRKPGFETLHFDVRVQPDRNITFRGQMRAAP